MRNTKFSSFFGRKNAAKAENQFPGASERKPVDNRAPIYIAYILDKSGSMAGKSTFVDPETGNKIVKSKIEQLNEALRVVIKVLKDFEEDNPLKKVLMQIIELDSVGKAVFHDFMPIEQVGNEINLEAGGCTNIEASLNTLKEYISPEHLVDNREERAGKGYDKALNLIVMSDGYPTDNSGYVLPPEKYTEIIDDFYAYLHDIGVDNHFYCTCIGVGDDVCVDMLKYLCDRNIEGPSHYYDCSAADSIIESLELRTIGTLENAVYVDGDNTPNTPLASANTYQTVTATTNTTVNTQTQDNSLDEDSEDDIDTYILDNKPKKDDDLEEDNENTDDTFTDDNYSDRENDPNDTSDLDDLFDDLD